MNILHTRPRIAKGQLTARDIADQRLKEQAQRERRIAVGCIAIITAIACLAVAVALYWGCRLLESWGWM